MNVTDVIKKSDPAKEFIAIEKGEVNLVMVFDHDALVKKNEKKIKRLYKLLDDEETVEEVKLSTVIDKIIESSKDDIDIEELLREVLSNTPPDLLLKVYSQLEEDEETEVEASSEPTYHCCYSLIFGDKRSENKIEIPISGGWYDRGG